MKISAICRGAPGLGRVAPAAALVDSMKDYFDVEARFASYGPGAAYLAGREYAITDLGMPESLFIDAVADQAIAVLNLVESHDPDLVIIDGEFYLPTTLEHLTVPVVYLANPHDLIGPSNTFRRVNRLLLSHADLVIISSLSCLQPLRRDDLVPGVPSIEVPALSKDIADGYCLTGGPPRVLISTGGGSVKSPALRRATDEAAQSLIDALEPMYVKGLISRVTLVLGADASAPARPLGSAWLNVVNGPIELANLYPIHDLLIARAGRNTIAEAAYCGIQTVLLPIADDRQRGSEQRSNVHDVEHLPNIFPLVDWRDRDLLAHAVGRAVHAGKPRPRPARKRVRSEIYY
jgi:hypothetical protein